MAVNTTNTKTTGVTDTWTANAQIINGKKIVYTESAQKKVGGQYYDVALVDQIMCPNYDTENKIVSGTGSSIAWQADENCYVQFDIDGSLNHDGQLIGKIRGHWVWVQHFEDDDLDNIRSGIYYVKKGDLVELENVNANGENIIIIKYSLRTAY